MTSRPRPSFTIANGIVVRPATHDDIDTLREVEMLARSTFTKRNEDLREIAEQGPYPSTAHAWVIENALTFVALMNMNSNSATENQRSETNVDLVDGPDKNEDQDGEEEDHDDEDSDDRPETYTRSPRASRYNLRNRSDETSKRRRPPSPDHGPNKRRHILTGPPCQSRLGPFKRLQQHGVNKPQSTISDLMDRVDISHDQVDYHPSRSSPKEDSRLVTRARPAILGFEPFPFQNSSTDMQTPLQVKDEESSESSSSLSSVLSSLDSEELGKLEREVTDTNSNSPKTIVGFLIAVPMRSRTGGTVIHVELLMVSPDYQQRGVGRTLLGTLIDIVDRDTPVSFSGSLSKAQRRRLETWRRKRLSLLTYDVPWGTRFYEHSGFKKVPHAYGAGPDDMPRKLKNNLDFHHLNVLAADSRREVSDPVPESALWCLVRNWRGR